MATFTAYNDGQPVAAAAGANAASLPAFTVFESTYDSAKRNVASGDTCTEFMLIPAGSFVLGVQVNVLTAEATVTLDVGDSADPNGFVAAQATAVAGRFKGAGAYVNTAGAMPTPRYYAADTYVQFTVGGAAATVASFKVSVLVANAG